MNIQILGSGSSGNCIKLCDKILIDLGLPFKKIKDNIDGVKTVLLSHCHSDHINKTTIRKLHIEDESIKFCCGPFMEDQLLNMGLPKKTVIIVEAGKKYKIDDVTFSPFNLHHDVSNMGYRVMHNGKKLIYATDTFSMAGITAKEYDYGLIEANHDLPAALSIIEQKKLDSEFCHLERAIKTHLNVDKAIEFIKENNIKKWHPVHFGAATSTAVNEKINKYMEGKA